MDEYNDLNSRFNDCIGRLEHDETGLDNIDDIKTRLDDFIKEYEDLHTKLNVPGADPAFIAELEAKITENKDIVKNSKDELDTIKTEKEKVKTDAEKEIADIQAEIRALKAKTVTSTDEYIKRDKDLDELRKRYREMNDFVFILDKGGNYKKLSKVIARRRSIADAARATGGKAKTEEKSIKYYIEKGAFPPNIKPDEWEKLCKDIGVNYTDMNTPLTTTEYKRLRHSKLVHETSIRNNITNKHNKVVKEYDKMIEEYKKLSSEMVAPELKDDKDKIDAMIVSLEAERADYVTKIGAMGYDVKNYFGLENSVSNTNNRGRAVNIDVKMDELETDLKSQYDLLNDQKDELNNSRSKFKKAIVTKKINRTMDRISRLQDKQGKLSTTQNMIINASSDRYIEKKMAENRKRMEEFRRVNEYNIKINELHEREDSLNNDILDISKDIADVTGMKLGDRIERMQLKASRRKLENELKRLKNKQGRTVLAHQIQTTITSSLGR